MTSAPPAARPVDVAASERSRQGVWFAFGAYGLWGLVPLFWPLLKPASALEILAHRVVWSLVIALALGAIVLRRGWWRPFATRRTMTLLAFAAAFVSVNWGTYIWAVNSNQVVETALGYYINPILSILIGVVFLAERLTAPQWVAVGLAASAVAVLTIGYGRLPWIALTLATSFALYGLLKKQVNAGAIETLTVESAYLTLPAIAYLIFLQAQGRLTLSHLGWGHDLLLVSSGLVTAVPLLFFAAAATRVPLSTLGLIQYFTPTAQFLLGVLWFHESMSAARWIGFGLVWIALMVMTVDALRRAGAARRTRVSEPI